MPLKPGRPKPDPALSESRTRFAARIFDTSDPPLNLAQCAALANIRPQTLREFLRRRELIEQARCPHCHQLPADIHRRLRYGTDGRASARSRG